MNDTDKVLIALGFFVTIGFLAYCVLTMNAGGSVALSDRPYVTIAELRKARENGASGR